MRRFAKICYDLHSVGRSDVPEALEEILNAEISIAGPTKTKAINLKNLENEDYQTVHPNVIASPEFPFMPAAYKLRRIEDYKGMKNELHRVKALKTLLNDVAWHD